MTSRHAPMCVGCLHLRRDPTDGHAALVEVPGAAEYNRAINWDLGRMHNEMTGACAAYPAGIPQPIWDGEVDHRQPYDGDHGITFAPIDAAAAARADELGQRIAAIHAERATADDD